MAKQYKRPRNDFVNSDDSYWYLREVDHLLEVPVCSPPRLEPVELVGTGGAPFRVADICMLPLERELLVALEAGGWCLHLYSGPELRLSVRIELREPVRRIASSSKGLYLLSESSVVRRVRLSALTGAIAMGEGRNKVLDLDSLPLETHRLPADLLGREDLLFVATPVHGPKPPERLLICTPNLSHAHVVLAGEQSLHSSRIELSGPKPVLRAPLITAACGSSDGSVFLFNEPTGQVLSFYPARARPTLRTIAGDGVLAKGHDGHFSHSLESRLRPLASLCEFRTTGRVLTELGDLARFSPSEGYAKATDKFASGSLKSIGLHIRSLIEQGSFLVGYDRAGGGVLTISAPTAIERVLELADTPGPRVMPVRLSGSNPRRAGPTSTGGPSVADSPTLDWDGCVLGPESSLIFWRRGASKLLRQAIDFSAFDALRRDIAFIEELNTRKGQLGRVRDFRDS